jgi:TPR repeat protein
MYGSGRGVPQNYVQAAKWVRAAAEQGNAEAQGLLGTLYGSGQGVPKDYVSAYMWLNLAAAQGEKEAAKLRDMAATTITPAQIAEAQKLAREWKPTKQPLR